MIIIWHNYFLYISADINHSQEVHCLGGGTDITLLLVWCHCSYVYEIQCIINFQIYKALCKWTSYSVKRIVKFTVPERIDVTNATYLPTFGKKKKKKKKKHTHTHTHTHTYIYIYIQGEHKIFPWLLTFITRKLRGIQTFFFQNVTQLKKVF